MQPPPWDALDNTDGRFDDAESDESEELFDVDPDAAPPETPGEVDSLFTEQLKLLPFFVRAAEGSDLETYEHVLSTAAPLSIAQYPQGVGCAAEAGKPAWSWRVWEASKALALLLERESELLAQGSVVELGCGAGLASLAAARLGAPCVCATDLPKALPLLEHNLELNGGSRRDGARVDSAAAAAGPVCCPSGHPIEAQVAQCEDHVCNVCNADVDEGAPLHCCRSCDFDMCDSCHRSEAGAAPAKAVSTPCCVRCPGGHTLEAHVAECEDHVCNVCGLGDPMGGGIDEGAPLHCCRACDFDVCGACHDRAVARQWEALPGWFRLQCQGDVTEASAWRCVATSFHCGLPSFDLPSPLILV